MNSDFLTEAEDLIKEKDYKAAYLNLRSILSLQPKSIEASKLIIKCCLKEGYYTDAIKYSNICLDNTDQSLHARFYYAKALSYFKIKQYKNALKYFGQLESKEFKAQKVKNYVKECTNEMSKCEQKVAQVNDAEFLKDPETFCKKTQRDFNPDEEFHDLDKIYQHEYFSLNSEKSETKRSFFSFNLDDENCTNSEKCSDKEKCPDDEKHSKNEKCLDKETCPKNDKCSDDEACLKNEKCSDDKKCPANKKCSDNEKCPKNEKCPTNEKCSDNEKCSKNEKCPTNEKCSDNEKCPKNEKCSDKEKRPNSNKVEELQYGKVNNTKTTENWDHQIENIEKVIEHTGSVRHERNEDLDLKMKTNNGDRDADEKANSSRKKPVNWDKMVEEFEKEEEAELKGDAAVNNFFQNLYAKSSDDVKKSMMKSFQESNGTVLSSNWAEVSKSKVEPKPPDGVEMKKF